jgi:asparagine synthase (glutamine-hydrolysing)
MCGLVGIWRHDGGEADQTAIDLMLAPIAHRGPDGRGAWQNGRVAFGHLRLSIIDLTEASGQPMLTADGLGVLVYNGEVYNYRELRGELEREGVKFRTSGDVEVVLQALHFWGVERSVKRFDGMFALAYLDRRTQALWLARDRIGIKPLIVADTGTELIFASEAKALLAHPRMRTRVDRHAVSRWIILGGLEPQRTLFADQEVVEPGSFWKITGRGVEKHQYFHALSEIDVDRLVNAAGSSLARFVSGFRDLLKKSVALHLASDVPLAAACSGGVDSSLIAAYAKEQLPDVKAFVADIPWPDGEGDQAERVARHLGIPICRVRVDQRCFLELWPHSVWHLDGPSVAPSDPALLAVAQKCRADGIKVLLTGEGSDELFGGYSFQQKTYDNWSRLNSWRRLFHGGPSRRCLTNAPFALMPGQTELEHRRRLILGLGAEGELLPQRFLTLLAPVESDADRAFLADCLYRLYQYLPRILHRHDRIGMAASMEMRVPFLQNDMFDFAFHLPRPAKLHRGIGKWVVKQAADEILPTDIVYAKKKGFPAPPEFSSGTQRLLVGGVLTELMEWPSNVTQEITASLVQGDLRYQLVALELWARMFFAGEEPATLGNKLVALAADDTSRKPLDRSKRKRRSGLARLAWRSVGSLKSLPARAAKR